MRKVQAANARAEQLVASGVNLEGHIPLKSEKEASEGASAGVADGADASLGGRLENGVGKKLTMLHWRRS